MELNHLKLNLLLPTGSVYCMLYTAFI